VSIEWIVFVVVVVFVLLPSLVALAAVVAWRIHAARKPGVRSTVRVTTSATSSGASTLEQLVDDYETRRIAWDEELAARQKLEARLAALFVPKGP
jgi:uncharacterized membrane protein YhaH (DUF805 family)